MRRWKRIRAKYVPVLPMGYGEVVLLLAIVLGIGYLIFDSASRGHLGRRGRGPRSSVPEQIDARRDAVQEKTPIKLPPSGP